MMLLILRIDIICAGKEVTAKNTTIIKLTPVAEIQFPRWGGGGGAKLHEFPTTLHRFARFTIAYCFTKTTLGQHI